MDPAVHPCPGLRSLWVRHLFDRSRSEKNSSCPVLQKRLFSQLVKFHTLQDLGDVNCTHSGMTMAPSFTIVIPTYNYGRYVTRAIDSALAATGPSREVIVVDDGSTDDTADVVRPYAERIVFERQTNQGVSAARNRGLELARGRYIVCLDADDKLLPNALDVFQQQIDLAPDLGIVFGSYIAVDEDGRAVPGRVPPRMGQPLSNFHHYLMHRFTIGNGRAAIRRSLFETIRYPVGVTHGEDLVVFGQVLALSQAVSVATPVSECFDHGSRARRNFERFLDNGTRTIDALFNPDILPPEAMELRPVFQSRWLLELARAALKLGRTAESRRLFHDAFACHWHTALDARHLSRYLRTYLPPRKAA